MTIAKVKFGQVEDAYATWTVLKGVIEITGHTDHDGILDAHVSFLLSDEKAEELAKMILERVQTRREKNKTKIKSNDSSKRRK